MARRPRLLLPLTLEFTAPELEAIDAHRELLRASATKWSRSRDAR